VNRSDAEGTRPAAARARYSQRETWWNVGDTHMLRLERPPLSNVQLLFLAVLESAKDDAVMLKDGFLSQPQSMQRAREVLAHDQLEGWLAGRSARLPFDKVCTVLDLEPQWIRRGFATLLTKVRGARPHLRGAL
jgi:hypothetical protein